MKNQNSEATYIEKRKQRAFVTYMFYHLYRLFPVNQNKIVFTAFEGDGGYCCNPRYVAEEILKRNKGYELIWLVNNMEKTFPDGISKVKNTFLNRAYHLATAGVWIDNSRKALGTAKRKSQLYIQTWHAALEFKPVGKFRGKLFPKIAYLVSAYDSKLADYVTSNSQWCTNLYPDMLLYHGEVIKTGSPRCDILINKRDEVYCDIRSRYGVPQDARIVMFAPTFRGGSQKGARQVEAETPTLDFTSMTKALEERFGGQWYVFLRLHPQLSAQMESLPLNNRTEHMVDVSQGDDMNELLCGADVLVTDYSSTAFDALCVSLPVFLYADDLEEYVAERGDMMWDMFSLPFKTALTNEELAENIRQFDEAVYGTEVDLFQKKHGVLEDGKASKRVVDVIEQFIKDSCMGNRNKWKKFD